MNIEEIKERLRRKATILINDGIEPSGELYESWIGSVRWHKEDEDIPKNKEGLPMIPVATIFVKKLPFVPKELSGIELITMFMDVEIYDNLSDKDLSRWFRIRHYESLEGIVPCEWNDKSLVPFPLLPELVENDFPAWDMGGMPTEIEKIILEMEESKGISYFDDICEEIYGQHKVGGYPSFCQRNMSNKKDYQFVMQITSDEKAGLEIVDSGNFYFFYNSETSKWKVYCDF